MLNWSERPVPCLLFLLLFAFLLVGLGFVQPAALTSLPRLDRTSGLEVRASPVVVILAPWDGGTYICAWAGGLRRDIRWV
jgi:hypothetical protein